MNPEVKALWLDALESGEYVQTQKFLRNGEKSFCCLGVLCDLYLKSGGTGCWVSDSADGIHPAGFHMETPRVKTHHGLPPEVQAWSGVSDGLGYVGSSTTLPRVVELPCRTLAHLNDNGYTFAEIAKVIREAF